MSWKKIKEAALRRAKKLEKDKIPEMEELKGEEKELEREEGFLKRMLKHKKKLK